MKLDGKEMMAPIEQESQLRTIGNKMTHREVWAPLEVGFWLELIPASGPGDLPVVHFHTVVYLNWSFHQDLNATKTSMTAINRGRKAATACLGASTHVSRKNKSATLCML